MLQEISKLQERLARGEIVVDAPCGAEPLIEVLGGLHARAAIETTHPGRFPHIEQELYLVESLVDLWKKETRND